MNPIGDEHPAEIGQGFDPRRDVDTVAINVIAVDEGNSSVDAPFQARENVGVAVARGRMLSSVRPLMRQGRQPPACMGVRGLGPDHP